MKSFSAESSPFLVNSNTIEASENVSGRVSGENLKSPREAIFTNPEGFQSGGVQFCQSGGVQFCQSGGSLFLPIRKGLIFANPEGSCFYQSRGVLILPIRRGTILSLRRGNVLSRLRKTSEKKVVKGIRLLGDRLGNSDCTGNFPFIKNQTKTKQI